MSANRERDVLSPEEKDFIHRVADLYAPPPLTPTQRTAFNRTLEQRLSRSARVSLLRPVAVAATACVAVLMWLTVPRQGEFLPPGELSSEIVLVAQPENATPEAEAATLLTYAYYNPDFYGEDNEEDEQFLPEEYEALATALAFPEV